MQNTGLEQTPGSTNIENAQSATLTHNNLVWKYTNSKNSSDIKLEIENGKAPNAYRAGYTNNPYAAFQVGFGSKEEGKIDSTKEVSVTLKLVK